MTKYEKLLTLDALKRDAVERFNHMTDESSLKQYEKGRIDAFEEAISILKNNSVGNAIKDVYLGKEK